jgi:hypothetical protein
VLARLDRRGVASRTAYLTVVAAAMIGWVWLLFVSVEWVLGV